MRHMRDYDGDIPFDRVSKPAARKAFDAGKPVHLCPCKLQPFGTWRPSIMIQNTQDWTFDKAISDFEWLNCSYEAGYRVSYYVQAGFQ